MHMGQSVSSGDLIHVVTDASISDSRKRMGRALIRGSFLILAVVSMIMGGRRPPVG